MLNAGCMLKRGVTERGEFAQRALHMELTHRGWWPFAYTLLADLAEDFTDADEALLERIYQSMAAGDGIRKITRRNRFPDLDEMLIDDCSQRFPNTSPLVIHDVGSSNGISSLELFERFRQARPVILHASDYYDRIYLVTIPRSGWTVVFDARQQPLQFVSSYFALSARLPVSWRYPINRIVQRHVRRFLSTAQELLKLHLGGQRDLSQVREVSLFHPRAVQSERQNGNFLLRQHNLFDPNPIACHIVRAMNILTLDHFPADRVRVGIEACLKNLQPGGLLLLGRSLDEQDGRVRASAYELRGEMIHEAWNINNGYEHPELVREATDAIQWLST